MRTNAPLRSLAAYSARLMRPAAVWRKSTTTDAGGGSAVTWSQIGEEDVQLVSPSATERETAAQEGTEITHTAVLPVDTDVERGDRLVVDGMTVELVSDPLTATHSAVARATGRQEPWDEPLT